MKVPSLEFGLDVFYESGDGTYEQSRSEVIRLYINSRISYFMSERLTAGFTFEFTEISRAIALKKAVFHDVFKKIPSRHARMPLSGIHERR